MGKNLKMNPDEFWRLSYLLAVKENAELSMKAEKILSENHSLRKRIHELEKFICEQKIRQYSSKLSTCAKDLESLRKDVASRLGVPSLDAYVLDDITYELKHLDKITEV